MKNKNSSFLISFSNCVRIHYNFPVLGWAQLSYLLWFAFSTYVVEHHLCSVSCICMPIQTSKQSVCVCVRLRLLSHLGRK